MSDLMSVLDLSTLDGTNGFRLDGIDAMDRSGCSVASAGDVNGDGFSDLVIGAFGGGDSMVAGESYVVFGAAGGFAASLSLGTLDGEIGFRLPGVDEIDFSGVSVASAGDVNGDGFDDVIIGAKYADPVWFNEGESYVVFGTGEGFAANVSLASLDGTNGFRLVGASQYGQSGACVASAGDVNADGYDDVIMGAIYAFKGAQEWVGETCVVFGKAAGFDASIDMSTLDGSDGFRLIGIDARDYSGISVASAGDIDGDGFDDLVIGASGADAGGKQDAGETYVVFGRAEGFPASFDLAQLDGDNGFRLDGIGAGDGSGGSVACAGDVNGDGTSDLLIQAGGAGAGAGECYLVFGNRGGFAASIDLGTLDGSNGVRILGVPDNGVGQVASAGDVNGDCLADLIIGAPGADGGAGAAYVVFGKRGGFAATLDLSSLDGSNGFRIDAPDDGGSVGSSVASAGDVNGDGFDDLIVGEILGSPTGDNSEGRTYVIFGRDFTGQVTHSGTAQAESLSGTADADVMVAGLGDDTLTGGRGNDVLRGGAGDDLMTGGRGADRIDGGSGIDTVDYSASGGAVSIDLATGAHQGAQAQGDRLNAIENVSGSDYGDTLIGDGKANTLDGRGGADTLAGGAGNDRYVWDPLSADAIVEAPGDGSDTILSPVSFNLEAAAIANVENLALLGSEGIDATGDSAANVLTGNAGNNVLRGQAGNDTLGGGAGIDTLVGGKGDDTYLVDSITDTVTENTGNGIDTVGSSATFSMAAVANVEHLTLYGASAIDGTGNSAANLIKGNDADNVLKGLAGRDTLDGGGGIDRLEGGGGNDTYVVDSTTDSIFETADGGVDTLQSGVSISMSSIARVENLTLLGIASIDGKGNGIANSIVGNAGANRLSGLDGADTVYGGDGNDTLVGGRGVDALIGGAGDDRYVVDATLDTITEDEDGGFDTVESSASFSLQPFAGVEALALTGTADVDATGNALSNTLTGNAAANRLYGLGDGDYLIGGPGNDTLTGGAGPDSFVFDAALSAAGNVDLVSDFVSGTDDMYLDIDVFESLMSFADGRLGEPEVYIGAGATEARNTSERIMYDTSTGALYYDADGSGTEFDAVMFAVLADHPTLSPNDFAVVF